MEHQFDEIFKDLPEGDMPFDSVKAWIIDAPTHQIVFFKADGPENVEVFEHAHGRQWGVVLEGEMDLTIDGTTHHLTKGDTYVIPAGAKHSGTAQPGSLAIDFFDDPGRHKSKG